MQSSQSYKVENSSHHHIPAGSAPLSYNHGESKVSYMTDAMSYPNINADIHHHHLSSGLHNLEHVGDPSHQMSRRKMLRRAANRKSAQLSRARKKAHMEDMKVENSRLQKLVDVLESQPEILICMNSSGRITYIPEKSVIMTQDILGVISEDEPVHIKQLVSVNSLKVIFETIAEVNSTFNSYSDIQVPSTVREIEFIGGSTGYMRCSKLIRSTHHDEQYDFTENDGINSAQPVLKRPKKGGAPSSSSHDSTVEEKANTYQSLQTDANNSNLGSRESIFENTESQMAMSFLVNAAVSLSSLMEYIPKPLKSDRAEMADPSPQACLSVSSCSKNGTNDDSDALDAQIRKEKKSYDDQNFSSHDGKNADDENNEQFSSVTHPKKSQRGQTVTACQGEADEYIFVIRPTNFSFPPGATAFPTVSNVNRESEHRFSSNSNGDNSDSNRENGSGGSDSSFSESRNNGTSSETASSSDNGEN